jgi:argonaute-like protein/RNase H domain-containing protein/MID domain-containing protein
MAKYESISTSAFVPSPGAATGSLTECYQTLAFPGPWRQPILDLYRFGRSDKIQQVPIRTLNEAIRAVAPDLVSVAKNAAVNDDQPWLYTRSEYQPEVLKTLIASWLHTLQKSPDAFTLLRKAFAAMDLGNLDWTPAFVDMLRCELTAGGTADPGSRLYHLLPDVLAARIEQLPPYQYEGERVSFVRVAAPAIGGAELMSWPPLEWMPKAGKGRTAHTWHYSGTIKISIQTLPFSPVPRVHLTTGIRRWVRGPVKTSDGDAATVYLRTQGPWLDGVEESGRFAAARLKVWRGEDRVRAAWAVGGLEGILSRVSCARDFPGAEDLAQDAEAWLAGRDAVIAAVTHSAGMGYHGVGVGLMPSERLRVTEWAGQALEPDFRQVTGLPRAKARKAKPKAQLAEHVPVPKEKKEDEDTTAAQVEENIKMRAAAADKNVKIDIGNAILRRQHLARAIGASGGSGVLACHLLYQTRETRDALIEAAAASLNLQDYAISRPGDTPETPWQEGTFVWRTPDLEVRIHVSQAGALVLKLGGEKAPKKGKQARDAIEKRRREVSKFLSGLSNRSQVVLVELEDKEAFFPNTRDPKFAIRLGCSDAGRVSQFIALERDDDEAATGTDSPEEEGEAASLPYRAAAAWGDALRQVGLRFIPRHTLGSEAIPDGLNQVAFWVVRRNSDGPTGNSQFTPIAVLIRPDQDCIMGRMPGMQQWVPYPELLRKLTDQVRGDELKYADQQKSQVARFVRQVLYGLRSQPTLVLTYAQNARQSWDWLKNGQIVSDKIQLADLPIQNLALYGGKLRMVRVRDGERAETAQWWAPATDEIAGFSVGLWEVGEDPQGDRVFFSTSDKASTHTDKQRDDTKLTRHIKAGKLVINPKRNAWNPTLLEITVAGCTPEDAPDAWAMYVHQQRFADDYRDALKFPLALHLAELATEYALPHDYEVLADAQDTEAPEDDAEGEEAA